MPPGPTYNDVQALRRHARRSTQPCPTRNSSKENSVCSYLNTLLNDATTAFVLQKNPHLSVLLLKFFFHRFKLLAVNFASRIALFDNIEGALQPLLACRFSLTHFHHVLALFHHFHHHHHAHAAPHSTVVTVHHSLHGCSRLLRDGKGRDN